MPDESELAHDIDGFMEAAGVHVDKFSQNRKTRGQLAGHPDRVYLGHGRLLYVELKAHTNTLTVAEEDWWDTHRPYFNSPYVDGCIWRRFDDALEWVEGMEELL